MDFFGDEIRIGKTLGTDLASGKLTLPLLALLERLPDIDRTELIAEITGERPSQLALRLQQMRELGIFAIVTDAVETELAAAAGALKAWSELPPTALLLGLCEVLRAQIAVLRPRD